MSLRDFRCLVSGVSLLGAEVAWFLLARDGEQFRPIALPLWGRYAGQGVVEEIEEGPNADLLIHGFASLLEAKRLKIDWEALGVEEQDIDDVDALVWLLVLAHVHGPEAVTCDGRPLAFGLMSAHVVASLMAAEPQNIPTSVPIEDLPRVVFGGDPTAATLFEPLSHQSARLRCRFGLSLVGLAALNEALTQRDLAWASPGEAVLAVEGDRERWLAEALARSLDDPEVVAGLEEYSAQSVAEPISD